MKIPPDLKALALAEAATAAVHFGCATVQRNTVRAVRRFAGSEKFESLPGVGGGFGSYNVDAFYYRGEPVIGVTYYLPGDVLVAEFYSPVK